VVAVCATIWTLVKEKEKEMKRNGTHVTKVCYKFVSAVNKVEKLDNLRSSVRQRSAFVLGGNDISSDERVMKTNKERRQMVNITCLHRPHWNASVSACWSAAPSDKNKLSSSIFASAALRSSEAISYNTGWFTPKVLAAFPKSR
jgi:hypothetical protein